MSFRLVQLKNSKIEVGGLSLALVVMWASIAYALSPTADPEPVSQERPAQNLDQEWRDYLSRYAGTTPLLAISNSRKSRFHIRDSHVDTILSGNTRIQLHDDFYYRSNKLRQVDLSSFASSLRLEAHDQLDLQLLDPGLDRERLMKETNRFRDIRQNMQQLVFDREETELLILFTGETHSLDLFFSSFLVPDRRRAEPFRRLEQDVIYVALPLDERTPFFTQEYLDFLRAMRGTQEAAMDLRDNDLVIYANFLKRLTYYNGLKAGLMTKADLKERPADRVGVLAVMDYHDVRLPQIFTQMPGVASLKRAGFDRVTVAMEGLKFGENYSRESLQSFYTANVDRYLSDEEEKKYYQRFRPQAYALLEKEFVSRPMMQALDLRLKSYQDGGLPVRLTGVESFNRLGFEPQVETKVPPLVGDRESP